MIAPRLALLACSATKATDPKPMPAVRRYQGPLWQTARAAGAGSADGAPCQLGFLSAAFGFGLGDDALPYYDKRMLPSAGAQLAAAIEAGEDRGTRELFRRAAARAGRPLEAVALVAGKDYLPAMLAAVAVGKAAGYIAGDARVTVINGTIGRMRQQLRAWVGGAA